MILWNADLGERYDFPQLEISAFFWTPNGANIGFLSQDGEQIAMIELRTGQVHRHLTRGNVLTFLDIKDSPVPAPLVATTDDPASSEFFLVEEWRISNYGRYLFQNHWSSIEPATVIVDILSGETFEISDPLDGKDDFDRSWSPAGALLAISEGEGVHDTQLNPDYDVYRLKIYDVAAQTLVASYKNIANYSWSPDGSSILHTLDPFHFVKPNPPCIFDLLSGATLCFPEVSNRHGADAYTRFYSWTPDGLQIAYAFEVPADNVAGHTGGFCLLTIATRQIDCPVTQFDQDGIFEEPLFVVHGFAFSPDGRFAALDVDPSTYYSYDHFPYLAILNLGTGEYTVVGELIGWYLSTGLWKPGN